MKAYFGTNNHDKKELVIEAESETEAIELARWFNDYQARKSSMRLHKIRYDKLDKAVLEDNPWNHYKIEDDNPWSHYQMEDENE